MGWRRRVIVGEPHEFHEVSQAKGPKGQMG
jgi:hypothetical protein